MARYTAIAAVSNAILGVLRDSYPKDEFGQISFKLVNLSAFENALDHAFSLCLYRIAPNGTQRNLPPRTAPDGTRYRPPLPLDLHYLVTPWAEDVEKQQQMLGWAMRTLEDAAVFPASLLNRYTRDKAAFAEEETVELVSDPLGVQDYVSVWDKLKPKLQTSVTYVARMVRIDSDIAIDESRRVQTREFRHFEVTP